MSESPTITFNDISTRDMKAVIDILQKSNSLSELVVNADLNGWDNDKQYDIFSAMKFTLRKAISNVIERRSSDNWSYITPGNYMMPISKKFDIDPIMSFDSDISIKSSSRVDDMYT